ncbi:WXG100 family type VII secretion target [Kitasatospora herbaricolor]|uniref:WXG100 family type VII secretion target n=1 Tax=Kitasatospora herbaricolor TaxID=68217 RepID=UPI0036DC9824
MTAQYSMKFGEVQMVVADLLKATNDIKTQLDQLDQKVSKLKAHWTGDAVEAYAILQRKWYEECAQMSRTLSTSGATLESIAGNTQRTERTNAAMFGG